MKNNIALAVIGGSGIYNMPGLSDVKEYQVFTPFGEPSSPILVGNLEGTTVAFLARHGIGHTISPGEINYRANIFALKKLGVNKIVSLSACGSLREDYAPGHIVIPDQLFDFTKDRKRTFLEGGLVGHIGVADPFCDDLSKQLIGAAKSSGIKTHPSGTFITIEGPRFSTRGESNTFRAWGMSIIGMTTSPEAFLAREAEMCYTVMAHVTDYDVWHTSEEPVTVEAVIKILNQNTHHAHRVVLSLLSNLTDERNCDCKDALKNALITNPNAINPEARHRLSLLVDKYIPSL